jgi:hypothetical protein
VDSTGPSEWSSVLGQRLFKDYRLRAPPKADDLYRQAATHVDRILRGEAPQRRAALSVTASITGWMSVGEREITRRISLVAVSRPSASANAARRRSFSSMS